MNALNGQFFWPKPRKRNEKKRKEKRQGAMDAFFFSLRFSISHSFFELNQRQKKPILDTIVFFCLLPLLNLICHWNPLLNEWHAEKALDPTHHYCRSIDWYDDDDIVLLLNEKEKKKKEPRVLVVVVGTKAKKNVKWTKKIQFKSK